MKKERVLLKEGLIQEKNEKGVLLASKCGSCGRVYFPQREFCPECRGSGLKTIVLSSKGLLYTYTIVNMPSAHYKPPYVIGWVEFPEGVRVFGLIDIDEETELKIGMELKPVAATLWEEEEKKIIAYRFTPVSE